MTPEQLSDFKARLARAAKTLNEMANVARSHARDGHYIHLRAKREGVLLALSYLDEYRREAAADDDSRHIHLLGLLEATHTEATGFLDDLPSEDPRHLPVKRVLKHAEDDLKALQPKGGVVA